MDTWLSNGADSASHLISNFPILRGHRWSTGTIQVHAFSPPASTTVVSLVSNAIYCVAECPLHVIRTIRSHAVITFLLRIYLVRGLNLHSDQEVQTEVYTWRTPSPLVRGSTILRQLKSNQHDFNIETLYITKMTPRYHQKSSSEGLRRSGGAGKG